MHIDINGGGLFGGASINDFQTDLDQFISNSNDILSAFKTIQSQTYNLNGGVGSLGEAVEEIGRRIQKEEQKIENAIEVMNETAEFIALAERVDKQVAAIVNQNKEEFYQMHPWLRPPQEVEDDRNYFEKARDYIKGKADEFGQALKDAWEGTKEALKKCWDSIVDFYEKHKKVIDTILAVVGAAAAIIAVVAGGGLLVLVPLLTAIGVSGSAAAAISAVVAVTAVVTTVLSTGVNIADIWLEIDTPLFNSVQKALNITSAISNGIVSIGAIYNAFHPGAIENIKMQMSTDYARGGYGSNGQYVDYLSDYVPGSDSGISRINAANHGDFYHASTGGGADVYVSTGPINQGDFTSIVNNANGHVNILTGTHGNVDGQLIPHYGFFQEDFNVWGNLSNIKIYDVTKMTIPQIRTVLFEKGTNICAWCYSERCKAVLQALNLIF